MAAKIYYDGECPFCTHYTQLVGLRDAVGPVELIDVRARPSEHPTGFDLDRGMVFEHEGRLYGGAEAMSRIAYLSRDPKCLDRLFQWPLLAMLLYPLLRAGRNLTLFMLGRQRIQPDAQAEQSLFDLFSHTWGVFSALHLLYYIYYEGATHVYPTSWALGILGVWLAIRPRSRRVFAALGVITLVDAWAQMPVYSNHTALRNFVLLAMVMAALYTWLRGRSCSTFVSSFAPVGRALLCVMYIFGVFHKINSDFLDPEISCAVALWNQMPEPLRSLNATWFRYAAIYGTLVGETLILIGLVTKRWRQWAIMAGLAFHSLLALSNYGFYPSFSTLTIALHLLYLSPGAAQRITTSPEWARLQGAMHTRHGMLFAVTWFVILWSLTRLGNTSWLGLAWLFWSALIGGMIYRHGRELADEQLMGPTIYSRTWVLNLITTIFFLNCLSPYLGLKNAQSINMFANLIHEGRRSNHLVFTAPPGPFPYLNDVVQPYRVHGNRYLTYVESNKWFVTYYDLLNQLDRTPDAVVSFNRGGVKFRDQSASTLKNEIERELHPRWFRNWFLFRPIDLSERKSCSLSQ